MIIDMIFWTWSWTKINCSVLIEAPSRSPILNHVFIIDSNEIFKTLYVEFKSNAVICHAKFYVLSYLLVKEMVSCSEYLCSAGRSFCNHSTEFLVRVGLEFLGLMYFFLRR